MVNGEVKARDISKYLSGIKVYFDTIDTKSRGLRNDIASFLILDGIRNRLTKQTRKLKFGDGVTAYNDLPYFGGVATGGVYTVEVEADGDHMSAITEAVGENELNKGDIAIVKELISDDKREYTAYVYNGTAWVAMDGNYNADNIYFDKNLIFTRAFGKFTPGASGSVEIPTAANGLSLKALLEQAFAEEKNPTITQPSTSITLTGAGAKEVGTEFTPSYSVGFNAGKYEYGPATGVTVTAYGVTDTLDAISSTQTGSFTKFTVADDTNYKVSVITTHTEGATPLTNLGNAYEAGKISAGTKSATSSAVTGYRNMFFGTMTTKPAELSSGDIRGLTTKQPKGNVTNKVISIPVGALRVVFAVPSYKTITSITDTNGLGAQILSSFVQTTVQVEGANSFTAIAYKVYYLDYASANDTANSYKVTVA